MTRLSVNINKVALLRNARGGNLPNLIEVAKDCERFGAEGITVHPRPDERHIRYQDVRDLKDVVQTELNVEGYPNKSFLALIKEVRPEQVTLVPDPPEALTSNAGWNAVEKKGELLEIVARLHAWNCRVSLFIEPVKAQLQASKEVGVDRVEFYTGPYSEGFVDNAELAMKPYAEAADFCKKVGLGLNAGHDLNLKNLRFFAQNCTDLLEVSIGHALISDALYLGLENTIQLYRRCLQKY